jgi:endonuclease IV
MLTIGCGSCQTFPTLSQTLQWARQENLKVIQTMTTQEYSQDDIDTSVKEFSDIKLFFHAPFTYSLIGTHKSGLFKFPIKNYTFPYYIKKNIEYQLKVSSLFDSGVVIHTGWIMESVEKSIQTAVQFLDSLDYPPNSKFLLENCSEPTKISSLENLSIIYQKTTKKDNVYLCLDTCHIFSAGEYDISKLPEIDRLYDDIETKFGKNKLALIHLNDSVFGFNSKKDRHAHSMEGKIWGDREISFLYFVDKFKDVPMVCETDLEDTKNILNTI